MKLLVNYFNFKGRLTRLPFFINTLLLSIFAVIITYIVNSIALAYSLSTLLWSIIRFLPLSFIVYLYSVLMIKRFHDLNRPGWLSFIFLGVLIASSVLLVLGITDSTITTFAGVLMLPIIVANFILIFKKGTSGSNRYGDNPLTVSNVDGKGGATIYLDAKPYKSYEIGKILLSFFYAFIAVMMVTIVATSGGSYILQYNGMDVPNWMGYIIAGIAILGFIISIPPLIRRLLNKDIHRIVRTGDVKRLKSVLKDSQLNINVQDIEGNTILHESALMNNAEIMEMILTAKADTSLLNKAGKTAFDLITDKSIIEKIKPNLNPLQVIDGKEIGTENNTIDSVFEFFSKKNTSKKLFFKGNVPVKRIENFIAAAQKRNTTNIPLNISTGNIMAMLDETILGSGKNAAVFTTDSLYTIDMANILSFRQYQSLSSVKSNQNTIEFYEKTNQCYSYTFFTGDVESDSVVATNIAEMMNSVIKYLDKGHESTPKAATGKSYCPLCNKIYNNASFCPIHNRELTTLT